MKKSLLAICSALAVFGSAQAATTNLGFEAGTTGWSVGNGFGQITSETQVTLGGMVDKTGTGFTDVVINPIGGGAGTNFGFFQPGTDFFSSTGTSSVNTTSSSAINFGTSNVNSGGFLFLRLVSGDYQWSSSGINDSVTVNFFDGGSNVISSFTLKSSDGTDIDSGWLQYNVPTGAAAASVVINDSYDKFNEPAFVAIDYSATPVPEPTSVAMMLAGIGALAFKGRRRLKPQVGATV